MPSKPKRLSWRLLAMGFGVALALCAAEALVRARRGSSAPERLPLMTVVADPTRGYAMLPGELHYTYLHPVRINQLGLRGPDLGPRVGGVPRWLLLGDSLVYGQGVGDDETLPHALELKLAELLGKPVEVVNGGVRAYATHQELALLDELGPVLEPDGVVLCWYWNDLEERDVPRTYQRLSASGPIAFDLAAAPEGLPLLGWHLKQVLRKSTLVMVLWDALMVDERVPPGDREVEAGFEKLDGYLTAFSARCQALGAQPMFVAIPDPLGLAGERSRQLEARARTLAQQHSIPTLDLEPALLGFDKLPVLPFDGHYDPRGNRALGNALAEWLAAQDPEAGG